LATSAWGNYANQPFTITYTDGTTRTFLQSFSEWGWPQNFTGESVAATLAYRNNANGSKVNQASYVYAYRFALDPTQQVRSITLPNQGKITLLAISLTPAAPPAPPPSPMTSVSLSSSFNRMVMATDGSAFSSTSGVDTSGHALSATLLGSSLTWNGVSFNLGP